MPIKHAALKQLRKDRVRHARNQAVRAELKTLTRALVDLLRQQKTEEAKALLRQVTSLYGRAAKKGVVHSKTASRRTSRLARRVARQT